MFWRDLRPGDMIIRYGGSDCEFVISVIPRRYGLHEMIEIRTLVLWSHWRPRGFGEHTMRSTTEFNEGWVRIEQQ